MAGVLGRRLTAVGVGTCVAFAAAEVTLRCTLPPVDLHDLSGIAADDSPMADWADVDAFCAYRAKSGHYAAGKTVSSQGFISTPELGAKDEGSLRIAFLGGSSTAGTSPILEDEQTWGDLVTFRQPVVAGDRKRFALGCRSQHAGVERLRQFLAGADVVRGGDHDQASPTQPFELFTVVGDQRYRVDQHVAVGADPRERVEVDVPIRVERGPGPEIFTV